MKLFKQSDPWVGIVIGLTMGLFGLSLLVNGFTHDLFLEAGVFLVSVKLILMAAKNTASEQRLELHLTQIKDLLAGISRSSAITDLKPTGNAAEPIRQL